MTQTENRVYTVGTSNNSNEAFVQQAMLIRILIEFYGMPVREHPRAATWPNIGQCRLWYRDLNNDSHQGLIDHRFINTPAVKMICEVIQGLPAEDLAVCLSRLRARTDIPLENFFLPEYWVQPVSPEAGKIYERVALLLQLLKVVAVEIGLKDEPEIHLALNPGFIDIGKAQIAAGFKSFLITFAGFQEKNVRVVYSNAGQSNAVRFAVPDRFLFTCWLLSGRGPVWITELWHLFVISSFENGDSEFYTGNDHIHANFLEGLRSIRNGLPSDVDSLHEHIPLKWKELVSFGEKINQGRSGDNKAFTDYMAVLGSMGLEDQIPRDNSAHMRAALEKLHTARGQHSRAPVSLSKHPENKAQPMFSWPKLPKGYTGKCPPDDPGLLDRTENVLTPLEMQLLMHYYHTPFPAYKYDSPAVRSAQAAFVALGILYSVSGGYSLTTHGRKSVDAILRYSASILR
jgi:hypothetical protein